MLFEGCPYGFIVDFWLKVRGMMYYRKALELQAFLDMAKDEEATKQPLRLITRYSSLRVTNIDEVEEPVKDNKKKINKVYYSCLVKAMPKSSSPSEREQNLDQHPGPAILGGGKPENLNHAIIFTRGEGLQTIDMNQDKYMEEALKIGNLLEEFLKKRDGVRFPSILGLREHIFTASVSSLAWFMSNQESSFVTIDQRLLANPLRVPFHYGHIDAFDRLFHLTRGGCVSREKLGISVGRKTRASPIFRDTGNHSGDIVIIAIFYLAIWSGISLEYYKERLKKLSGIRHFMVGDFCNAVCDEGSVQIFNSVFRIIKGMIFLTFVSILVTWIALPHMTLQYIVVCILAFMPTGWGMLQIAQALKPLVRRAGFWGSVKTLARGYEVITGLHLFTPVAFLARFPFKPVCCSTKHSAEVCKFLIFSEVKGKSALLVARNSLSLEGLITRSLKLLVALIAAAIFSVAIVNSCL
ncbi:hypothetical protein RJT34_18766 [Clitoria ternatea]|uniref:Glycosyl transferase 48 domain-containing protein n=1 Tax=Clitoria ternatea TaxID=43366 RepID=A0AAN9JEM2_CLITE